MLSYQPKAYTKDELRAMLPSVGDRLLRPLTSHVRYSSKVPELRSCVVVEVNREHCWYRVRFDNLNVSRCFKLPDLSDELTE